MSTYTEQYMVVHTDQKNFSSECQEKNAKAEFLDNAKECEELMVEIARNIANYSKDVTWSKLGSLKAVKQRLIETLAMVEPDKD